MNAGPLRRLVALALAALALSGDRAFASGATGALAPGHGSGPLRQDALQVLRQSLQKETGWTKVHAAEALLSLGYGQAVKPVFEQELVLRGTEPQYRIGIWRVLAQAASAPAQRDEWIAKIRTAFLDPAGPDRLHAAEALGKLGYRAQASDTEGFESAAKAGVSPLAANARWVLANSGEPSRLIALAELLSAKDTATRADAAYALRHLPHLCPRAWEQLQAAALREPANSEARVFVLGAAVVHSSAEQREQFLRELRLCADQPDAAKQREFCAVLGRVGKGEAARWLKPLLREANPDVRIGAAQALLRLDRRRRHGLGTLDGVVILLYALVMLGVGWYWSRRTVTTEGYLLGGRHMRPWMVGMSLFASLLSIISYLAMPGEVIRYGPMILSGVAAYPFILLVVGWLLIPAIMKFRATTAYEILESRLGVSVRMVGSVFFLSLRLLWMAVIVYATSEKVLVPMLNLPPAMGPYLSGVLGLVTVAYTAMGGLPAVVLNDVMQTFILFFGAILSLIVITSALGGVSHWWPTHWPNDWPAPQWGYNPKARISFIGITISSFTWYVCTSGSDQMAVQRYLSTRDTRAARRALFIALSTDVLINLFLAVLGFALLAYFQANPHLLAEGQSIAGSADRLFPRFILLVLPPGLRGLVFIALLAAAMGSLSSGINSSSSVVTVDFLERFGKPVDSPVVKLRRARFASLFIGVGVVLLSLVVHGVQGNLLEVTYKVVNLLVAPLFGLFALAMFVRRATVFGTLVGAAGGLAVVTAISYWQELTGTKGISFVWAMPLGLVAEVGLGLVASLLPIRANRRPGATADG